MKRNVILLLSILLLFNGSIPNKVLQIELLPDKIIEEKVTYKELHKLISYYTNKLSDKQIRHVYNSSIKYKVNPLLLVVKLQVEQSLIQDHYKGRNWKRRLSRACGFGTHYEYITKSRKFRGFKNQVYSCAEFIRRWYDKAPINKKMRVYDMDRKYIIARSKLTYVFFKYTPYYGEFKTVFGGTNVGNALIPLIFKRYKNKLKKIRSQHLF